jgi:hypothetical protein
VKPSVEAVRLDTHRACAKLQAWGAAAGWAPAACCSGRGGMCSRTAAGAQAFHDSNRRHAAAAAGCPSSTCRGAGGGPSPAVDAVHAVGWHGPVDEGKDTEHGDVNGEKHKDELPPRQTGARRGRKHGRCGVRRVETGSQGCGGDSCRGLHCMHKALAYSTLIPAGPLKLPCCLDAPAAA